MWSKMKAILRRWKIRNLDILPDAIQKALACVPIGSLPLFAVSIFEDCYKSNILCPAALLLTEVYQSLHG